MTTVNVSVVCFPDGSTIHLRDATPEQVRTANEAWRNSLGNEELIRHHHNRTGGGMVVIRMLASDYRELPTSNHPALLALLS